MHSCMLYQYTCAIDYDTWWTLLRHVWNVSIYNFVGDDSAKL